MNTDTVGFIEETAVLVAGAVNDFVPNIVCDNDAILESVRIDDNVREFVRIDDIVGITENDANDDFIEESDGNLVRLWEKVGFEEMEVETHEETVACVEGEEYFDGIRADCEPVKLLIPDIEGKVDTVTLSVARGRVVKLTFAEAETVLLIDSIAVCVIIVENVGEVEGLGVFDVERLDDLDVIEDGVVERVGVPERDVTEDFVAIPPVWDMTAEFDADDVPLFETARHPVAVTDDDAVTERVGLCDLLDEEEEDGDRLISDVRLSEVELEGERETIVVLEEVGETRRGDRVDTDETDADIEKESCVDGLFENDAWGVPVFIADTFDVTLSTRNIEGDGMVVTETDPVGVTVALVVDVIVKRDDIDLVWIAERDFKAEFVSVKTALEVIDRDGKSVVVGDIVGLVEREGDLEVELVADDVWVPLLHEEIETLIARDGDKSLEPLAKEAVEVMLTRPDRVAEIEANGETESELALDSECEASAENDPLLEDVIPENEGIFEEKEVSEDDWEAEVEGVGLRVFFAERVKKE